MIIRWIIVIIAAAFFSAKGYTQPGKLPPFRMVQPNGKIFKAEDLPLGKPILLIYFSPECDHCEKLAKELLKRKNDFQKVSVAMVTYLGVAKVSKFVKQFKLDKQSNIYAGTEGTTYFLKNYYKIEHMPFMALYTKEGNLVKTYSDDDALIDIIKRVKALK